MTEHAPDDYPGDEDGVKNDLYDGEYDGNKWENQFESVSDENEPQIVNDGTAIYDPHAPDWSIYMDDEDGSGGDGSGAGGGESDENYSREVGPKPGEVFGFEVSYTDKNGNAAGFNPFYYPERFNVSKDRDTKSEADSCKGENVTITKINNSRIHAQGIMLKKRNLDNFHKMMQYVDSVVTVHNPLLFNGGQVECILHKTEFGEIVGWDPKLKQWQIGYTLDFISTGEDEATSSSGKRGVVAELDGE